MFQSETEELKEKFENASLYVRSLVGKINSDDLLYFYARFKRANDGHCNTSRPGFFDFQGKQKWDAWKGVDESTEEQCMQEYVCKLTQLEPNWEDDMKSGKTKPKAGFGVGVSKMMTLEGEGVGGDGGVYDLCKEGLIDRLVEKIEGGDVFDVNQLDDQGMSMLHWSCDRGHYKMTEYLLQLGADVNIRDQDLQTPLHYAISCEHEEVIKLLLQKGADPSLRDSENLSSLDIASKHHHKQLLLGCSGCCGTRSCGCGSGGCSTSSCGCGSSGCSGSGGCSNNADNSVEVKKVIA